MKIIKCVTFIIGLIIIIFVIRFHIDPEPFKIHFDQTEVVIKTIPLPEDLPEVAEDFYLAVYSESLLVIESAIIIGNARLRLPSKGGINFPGRFKFVHLTGEDYSHYIEVTLFGIPIIQVNENYINGKSRMELPFGVNEGEKVDQGAKFALWAEAVWFPSLWITDPDMHWEALDETSAYLFVPYGDVNERLFVSFDSETNLITDLESMCYKGIESNVKTKWFDSLSEWQSISDHYLPSIGAITWEDEGKPWAIFCVNEIIYNADIQNQTAEP